MHLKQPVVSLLSLQMPSVALQGQLMELLAAVSELLAELLLSKQDSISSVAPVLKPTPIGLEPKAPPVIPHIEFHFASRASQVSYLN